ncbi:MAG TPA: tetratricopeptide repeat protein [Planctomycetota bacterium]|nr:tetratricopeptide repeat protein [Planctomycetota bacterium]
MVAVVLLVILGFAGGVVSAQGESERAKNALRELQDEKPAGAEMERSRARWPEYGREIDEAVKRQDDAVLRGGADADDAVKHYENRAEVRGGVVDLYLAGRILGNTGRVEEAKKLFEKAIQIDPWFPWAYHGLGTCHVRRERFEDAVKAYRRALELDPSFIRAMEPLAVCLIQLERPQEAEDLLRRILERHPENQGALRTLARIHALRHRFGEAIELLRKLLELRPEDDEARRMLAYCYREAERPEDAEKIYLALVKAQPEDRTSLKALAGLKLRQGENHVAADYYRRVLKLTDPGSPEAESLRKIADDLQNGPAIEKRNPKQKTADEWMDVLLNSVDEQKCLQAVRVLGANVDDVPTVEQWTALQQAFLQALKSKFPSVKVLALRQVERSPLYRSEELARLAMLFLDRNQDRLVRAQAAETLGELRHPSAVPAIVDALAQTDDPYVFERSFHALVKLAPQLVTIPMPETLDRESMADAARQWKDWYAAHRDRYKRYEAKADNK